MKKRKNILTKKVVKRIKKSILSVFVAVLLIQNIQVVAAANELKIRELFNEKGPYYGVDIHETSTPEVEEVQEEEETAKEELETLEIEEEILEENPQINENEIENQEEVDTVLMMSFFNEEKTSEEEKFEVEEVLDESTTVYVSTEDPNLKKLVISSGIVNYETSDGSYEVIETEVQRNSRSHDNVTNSIESSFEDNVTEAGVKFKKGTGSVVIRFKGTQLEEKLVQDSQVIYPLENHGALKYQVYPNEIHQELIYTTPMKSNQIELELEVNGVAPSVQSDKIEIYTPLVNKAVLELFHPSITDNEGKTGEVSVSFDGTVLKYTVSEAFLENAVYPISIKSVIKGVDNRVTTWAHLGKDISVAYNFATSTIGNISLSEMEGYSWVLPSEKHYEAYLFLGNNPYKIGGTALKDSYSFYKLVDHVYADYGIEDKYIKSANLHLPIKEISNDVVVYGCTIQGTYDVTKATYNTLEYPIQNSECTSATKLAKTQSDATLDITDYVKGVVEKKLANNGVLLVLEDKENQYVTFHASEYYYINNTSGRYPAVSIEYYDQADVSEMDIKDFTFEVRPFTKYKYETGLAHFSVLGIDGVAPLGSKVTMKISEKESGESVKEEEMEVKENFYVYPKYPEIDDVQKYAQGQSNYQFKELVGNSGIEIQDVFKYNQVYEIEVSATKGEESETKSTWFQLYEVKSFDVLSSVAAFYGVEIEVLIADNNLQDQLIVEDNVLFIREPKRNAGKEYETSDLSEDIKKEIDAALVGRGLQCEFGFEPINLNTGNYVFESEDTQFYILQEKIGITRVYNSKNADVLTSLGYGWSFEFETRVSFNKEKSEVVIQQGDGKRFLFRQDSQGNYVNELNGQIKLREEEGRFIFSNLNEEFEFNRNGSVRSITKRNGNKREFYYNQSGLLEVIRFANGQEVSVVYNEDVLISEVILSDGKKISYEYDENLNLVSFKDLAGFEVKYDYNEKHEMIRWENRKGQQVIENEYDENHRVTKQSDGLGVSIYLEYEENKTITTDGRNNQEIIYYDDYGQTTRKETSEGEVLKSTRFEKGLLMEETLRNGVSYTYEYDEGYLSKMTRSDGYTEEIRYDENHNPIQLIEGDQETTFEVDSKGNIIKKRDALGNQSEATYNSFNQVIKKVSESGASTTHEYDELGNLIQIRHDSGDFVRYSYNELGYIVSETDSYGMTKTYTHSERHELIKIEYSDGSVELREFDESGNLVKEVNRNGHSKQTQYDVLGNVIQQSDYNGNVTYYEYDENQNVIQVIEANGSWTKYTYDHESRVIEQNVNGLVTKTQYNEKGQVVQSIDARGNATKYEVDELGNIIKTIYPNQTQTTNTINELGQVVESVDGLGNKVKTSYDEMGRVIETQSELNTTKTTYNETGQVIQVEVKSADSTKITSQEFNAMGQLVKEMDEYGNQKHYFYEKGHCIKVIDGAGNSQQYSYDINGKISEIHYSDGTKETFEYDAVGNLVQMEDKLGIKTSFTFDPNNNLISQSVHLKDGQQATIRYSYNSQNKIAKEVSAEGVVSEYKYDLNGNLIQITKNGVIQSTFVMNEYNEVVEEKVNGVVTQYDYDEFGRRIKDIQASGLVKEYVFDEWGQICEIKLNGQTIESFEYDQFGRVILFKDAMNQEKKTEYNSDGNIIEVSQSNRATQRYSYDEVGGRLIKEEDSLGNQREYKYDALGNVIEVNSNGNLISSTYDSYSRKLSDTNSLGDTTYYEYDVLGRQIAQINAFNVKEESSYNELGQKIESKINGVVMSTSKYDFDGNLLSTRDALGNITQTKVDAFGQVVLKVDASGYATSYHYDDHHNLIEEKNALGDSKKYEYNALNQQVAMVDEKGNKTQFDYDLFGNVVKTVYPNKAVEINEYNELNQLISSTDIRGLKTETIYDEFGRVIEVKVGNITQQKTVYDEVGRIIEVSDVYGNKKITQYNSMGQVIEVIDEKGNITQYEYDSESRVICETSSYGVQIKTSYDALGQEIKVSTNDERSVENEYDIYGNLVKISVNGQLQSTNEYDLNHQLIKTTDALGNHFESEYNEVGNIISQTQANGAKTSIVYDELHREVQTKSPLGNITTYTYDKVGNLIATQNPRGHKVSYEVDVMGNTIKESGSSSEKTMKYNLSGDCVEIKYDNGKKETFEYDEFGRVTQITQKDKSTLNYTYDEFGNCIEENKNHTDYDSWGNPIKITNSDSSIEIEYDSRGQIIKVNQDGQEIHYSYNAYQELEQIIYPTGSKVEYTYDEFGRLIYLNSEKASISYEYNAIDQCIKEEMSTGLVVTFEYDEVGNKTKVTNSQNGLILSHFESEYNLESSVIKEIREIEGESTTLIHEYNENDELVKSVETKASGEEIITEYVISIQGNKVEVKGSKVAKASEYNEDNQLIKHKDEKYSYEYRYDDNGNRVEEKRSDGKKKIYTYNELNQLIQVVDFDKTKLEYKYDGLGNRIEQKANRTLSETSTQERSVSESVDELIRRIRYVSERNACEVFFYGEHLEPVTQEKVVTKEVYSTEEVQVDNTFQQSVTIQYINDLTQEHSQVLSSVKDGQTTHEIYGLKREFNDERVYTYDGYNNVIHDVSMTGGLKEKYEYSAYGVRDKGYDPFIGNSEYGYRAEAHTKDGLQYLRARYYHPENEQFIQEDSYLGEKSEASTRNRYTYVINNPYKYSDPSGHIAAGTIVIGPEYKKQNGKLYKRTGRVYLLFTGTYENKQYKLGVEVSSGRGNSNSSAKRPPANSDTWKPIQRPESNTSKPNTSKPNSNIDIYGNYQPQFGNGSANVPILTKDTPRVNSTMMADSTKDLIQKAAVASNVSVKMMEEILYAKLTGGDKNFDWSRYENQGKLEERIRDLCEKIAKDKLQEITDGIWGGPSLWDQLIELGKGIVNFGKAVINRVGDVLSNIAKVIDDNKVLIANLIKTVIQSASLALTMVVFISAGAAGGLGLAIAGACTAVVGGMVVIAATTATMISEFAIISSIAIITGAVIMEMAGGSGGSSGDPGTNNNQGSGETEVPKYPGNDGTKSPGKGWEWRGEGGPETGNGNWYNPSTGESLHPDLSHPDPIGPHWDWKDVDGKWWRLYPDGSKLPK